MTPLSLYALVPLLLPEWLDPAKIIEWAGPATLWVVAFIIFAECGIFSILPGDSLLFTVGMFMAVKTASGDRVISYGGSVGTTMLVVTLASLLGLRHVLRIDPARALEG